MATGWQKIGGAWYLFRPGGAMVTGWYQWADGSWSYSEASGAARTGWIKSGGRWYYISPSTYRTVTGTQVIGGKAYAFDSLGRMV
ncbi:MAG: hypothetical protein PUD02_04455 [Eggerthellales bacterium]|nr:hypothetical protein [Eggerthellales bacterium]